MKWVASLKHNVVKMDSHPFGFTVRQLSAQETIADLQQFHGANILIHASIIKSEVKLTQSNFEQALRKLVDFQPTLRMKIASSVSQDCRSSLTRRFEEMTPVHIDFMLHLSDKRDSWIRLVEDEMATAFNSQTGPLWKVMYVEMPPPAQHSNGNGSLNYGTLQSQAASESHITIHSGPTSFISMSTAPPEPQLSYNHEGVLIFKIHHAIADGVSMMSLIQDQFLHILKGLLTSGSLPSFSIPSHIMPAADSAFKNPKLTGKYLRIINYENAISARTLKPPVQGVHPPPVPLIGSPTGLVATPRNTAKVWCYKLPRALGKAIKDTCQRYRVTLEDTLIFGACHALAFNTDGGNMKLPGDSVLCSHATDLRQFQRKHGNVHPLGMWKGYDVKRFKVKEHSNISTSDKFWKAVGKFASSQSGARRPWSSTRVYQDLLEVVQANANVRPVAEMYKSHMEISVFHKEAQSDRIPSDYASQGPLTQTPNANWVNLAEQYVFCSVSDLSNSPMSLSFVFYGERAYCNVTYNSHWLSEDFIKAFVIAHTRIMTRVTLTGSGHSLQKNKISKKIVAVQRAKNLKR
ncbi:hypothetical protein CAPTEDRAFT_226712 [Capitella teleta]|uniref:Condensation domain-containing protein n=1 Tax=Capitella teleta TaxID=283909 RepID=R7U3R5_CAPTE|nr:hypothetical protein CAPTEDRAFT_226712 [Capitella teleta]|eukprot:ELT97795.1 hypothetical protein CAPTEDRAFT_226712 [Capitella teleta]